MSKETFKFDAEVDKIFKLMIHSLYENKEIFLRELISNASDACDRLRYKALTTPDLINGSDFQITISTDSDKKTLTITDNGIGMSRNDLIKNLGTIARSGTQNFLKKLTGENKKDNQLIGQFGVGFYSSFMIADKVIVISKEAGKKKAHIWQSKGDSKFTIDEIECDIERGTKITLYLRDDETEYLEKFRIQHIVKTYSNHVAFDIVNDEGEILNDGKALWLKSKSEISKEEYKEFYKSLSHMGTDEPWLTLHNKSEGTIEYTNLLFIPSKKPFDLFHPDRRCQVKLYVKRVFIAEEGIEVIPAYLRFLRGIIDSEDLPLNISRETVQNNVVIHKIRKSLIKRVLNTLAKKADKAPEEFTEFWENFGSVLKEGLCDGMEPRDEIIDVCRFRTTTSDGKLISLKEYKNRMKEDQKEIYYITGDETVIDSPQLEGFKEKDIEVLLLTDSVDEFWVNVLHEYKGTALKSVTRASTDIGSSDKDKTESPDDLEPLINFIKETLGEDISDVRTTDKLTSSPVCLTAQDGVMDIRMERFMVENKQLPESSTKILEINSSHPIITKLAKNIISGKTENLADTVQLLFAQANIIEGEPIKNVKGFTETLNTLLKKAI